MNARAVAIQVLARVEATDAYLNVALDARLAEEPPEDPRDAALVTELCYGTTRRRLALDAAIAQFSDRKLDRLEDRVLAALRVGAYQMFYTRIPRRAAVAETVEALKSLGLGRASGFANAVLRKLSALDSLPASSLSLKESHPEWLVARWTRQFGPARAAAMLAADNEPPAVTIRANTARTSRDELLGQLRESGLQAEPTKRSPVGIVLSSAGKLEDLLGYDEGLWQVQDEAAQLVGVYAAIPDGVRALDACAAPGGKACHLAERGPVVASDLHQTKLRKIETEAKRLGLGERITTLAHDATKPFPEKLGEFEAVLVDAPCSGLGTLRRHPELRYRRKEEDIGRLAALQREILERCQERVAPGGLLVYAVCSTDPEEGQDQTEMFLRSHPEFTAEPSQYLRTLPDEGLDGFFAARLRKLY